MKLFTKRILSYFPTKLPLGAVEYQEFLNDIRALLDSRLNAVPDDDISFVVAANITHGSNTADRIAKQKVVRIINAAAAKQVAGQVFQEIKQRQAARQAAQLEQAAATTAETPASGNSEKTN